MGQKSVRTGQVHLADLEQRIDDVAREIAYLIERGAAAPDEAAAFEACIEDLWISLARLRRSLVRGCGGPCANARRRKDILTVIRMLTNDIAFARERQHE